MVLEERGGMAITPETTVFVWSTALYHLHDYIVIAEGEKINVKTSRHYYVNTFFIASKPGHSILTNYINTYLETVLFTDHFS